MKIRSKIDVITNSSTEVFILRKPENYDKDGFKGELKKHVEENCFWNRGISHESFYELSEEEKEKYNSYSGTGGVLFINDEYDYKLEFDDILDIINYQLCENIKELPDKFLYINFDWNLRSTAKYLLENFEVIYSGIGLPVADENDNRIKELWGLDRKEEWDKLKDHPTLYKTKINVN